LAHGPVDFHTHLFPTRFLEEREDLLRRDRTFRELYARPTARMADTSRLLEAMDRAGVATAVVLGIGWTSLEVAREANDALLEAQARHPDRLVAFCSVNPAWGEPALEELERCARAGARGVGELHPDTQGFDLTDPTAMAPFVEAVRRWGLLLLLHTSEPVGHLYPGKGRTTPERVLAFRQAFPDLPLVLAHLGGGLPFYAWMPEVRDALALTWVDTSALPFLYRAGAIRTVVEALGPGAVLFGSDFPLLKPERALHSVEEAGLDPDTLWRVREGNARALLDRKR